MKIETSAIVAILRQRDLHARADWVERTLPAVIDTNQHTGLLATLHIKPADLAARQP